jgi:uncharacterized NAD-dependent epimerase/dehydratase family protein
MTPPFLIFLGDVPFAPWSKTGWGLKTWREADCLAQLRLPGCVADLGLPDMTPGEAAACGARTMVIGVVNDGGIVSDSWIASLTEALEAGLDLVAGMHTRLADIPAIAQTARRLGRTVHDVRHPTRSFGVGTGKRRAGRRLLTVGTDCGVGKKFAALAIDKAIRARGIDSDFRATGQTGIMITGRGVAVDSVVADFVSGAAEWLSPANDPDHWDVIEGQGSLFHPAYAAVTLGLIHGSQPDALVVCHAVGRDVLYGFPEYPTPSLTDCMAANVMAARLTNPAARVVGISLNTASLDQAAAEIAIAQAERDTGLPCCDPIRQGADRIVEALLEKG